MLASKLAIRTALTAAYVVGGVIVFGDELGQGTRGRSLPVPPPAAPVKVEKSDDSPETGAHLGSQAAADLIRSFANADGAFLAAGLVKQDYSRDNLASLLQYQTDEIVIVSLTGAQIKQAFERSVSFYPQPSASFLQISGFEVTFAKNPDANPRVITVTVGGSRLDESHTYTVAMPSSLGRGALGYFKIWDKSKITKTFTGQTVESILKDKRFFDTSPRWSPQG
jgi:hypothetical protein